MNEIEILEIDIKNLNNAIDDIESAMNNINEVDGLQDEYKQLDNIYKIFDNKKIEMMIELENLQEEAYFKENEEQWKAENLEQELEYRRMVE